MRGYTIDAIVLGRSNLGERDRLVILLSRDRGKVRAVVRGANKTDSKLAGLVQPFSRSRLDLWRGRSLDGLRSGEVLESFRRLRAEFDSIAYASCMAEITGYIAQEDEKDEPLYLLLLTCFRALERAMDHVLVGAFFCVRVIKVLGVFPVLDQCVVCGGPVDASSPLRFSQGGLTCARCRASGGLGTKISTHLCRLAESLRDIHPRELAGFRASREDLLALTELFLDYAEFQLDRRVNSRSFLDILG